MSLKTPKLFSLRYIWRQDISLQWCKDSKSLLSGRLILVTCTGDREIRSVSERLPDFLGELACMQETEKGTSLVSRVILTVFI